MSSILIIDDHKDFREAMKNFILMKGIKAQVMEAVTGEEGIKLAHRRPPEVVIIDVYLGTGINGLETASIIRREVPACGIIVLTMYDVGDMKSYYKAKEVDEFIDKSALDVDLVPAINRLLSSKPDN